MHSGGKYPDSVIICFCFSDLQEEYILTWIFKFGIYLKIVVQFQSNIQRKVLAKICKFEILTADGCDPNLCQNGRLYYEGDGNYFCECTDGFIGINCETSM